MGKAFEKQAKTIKDQEEKQADPFKIFRSPDKQLPSIKDFTSKEKLNPEMINELERIKKKKRKKLMKVEWFT